ncbi:MAG: coproporphyrinogen III oxidase family protein, partial [Muribaculaceae bacterium]|nr:coproporphyrinogen III oxidase family protein [Muribaculaceae bacterium]
VSVDEWKRGGVNRVSVGVQTFNDKGLKSIGRRHTGESAEIALIQLMSHFSNVSADLIFGLPGQSLEDLNMDIERILKLKPQHISIYSLMYEEGTAITYLRDAGRISPVDDEVATEMFKIIINRLNQAGYNRYEISNYSIAGFESRHNRGYWTGRRYIGIGPSAHSFDGDSKRSSNPADIMGYLNRVAPKESEDTESHYQAAQEELTQMQKIEEMIMLSLRMKEGIDLNQFLRQYGLKEQHNLMKRAQKSIRQGNLICDIEKRRLYLSDSGVLISDSIILDLIP